MATEMTPQERAAALLERMGLCGHPAASQFVGDIIEHDQQTRRAALLEQDALFKRIDAALTDWLRCYAPEEFTDEQLAETRERLHGGTLAYIAHLRRDIKDAVNRLAQEG